MANGLFGNTTCTKLISISNLEDICNIVPSWKVSFRDNPVSEKAFLFLEKCNATAVLDSPINEDAIDTSVKANFTQ